MKHTLSLCVTFAETHFSARVFHKRQRVSRRSLYFCTAAITLSYSIEVPCPSVRQEKNTGRLGQSADLAALSFICQLTPMGWATTRGGTSPTWRLTTKSSTSPKCWTRSRQSWGMSPGWSTPPYSKSGHSWSTPTRWWAKERSRNCGDLKNIYSLFTYCKDG